ncbi:hypothetical protein [Mesorhizobium sp. M0185]|uniref:hypothetical protein n=1 Tax=unclassified Mesorhizobium TaxID=325217 RepID=UPI0033354441
MRVVRRAGARQDGRLDRFFARIIVKRRSYVEKLDDIAAVARLPPNKTSARLSTG